ncbi:hypothetical protein DTO271G3_4103 [Paecilomyces variotii]|nr:hypothetical protein DTO271G3_4103 [Paecilomyces variotii]
MHPKPTKPSPTETTTTHPARPLHPSDTTLPIHAIRIALHTIGLFLSSDTRSGNHVSIYLLPDTGTSTSTSTSIRLDMFQADLTDTLGTYRVRWCEYEVSKRAVKAWDLMPVKGKTILTDMEKYNYISPHSPLSAAFVKEALRYNYSKSLEPVFDEIVQGTFLSEKQACDGQMVKL